MSRLRPLAAALAMLPLAACLSFGAKPPATLMTLSAESTVSAGPAVAATPAGSIAVLIPSVPQALATVRVPVQTGPTAIAYLKDAQWVDTPNKLFRTVLAETIEARTGKQVPDARNFALAPEVRLSGRLVNFGLDAAKGEAVATFDATLAREGSDQTQNRRFEARVATGSEKAPAVAAALNSAANQVAAEVADWVK